MKTEPHQLRATASNPHATSFSKLNLLLSHPRFYAKNLRRPTKLASLELLGHLRNSLPDPFALGAAEYQGLNHNS